MAIQSGSIRLAFLALLAAAASGCTEAYKSDEASDALTSACAEISTTGDLFRHCMEVGPDAALRERTRPATAPG